MIPSSAMPRLGSAFDDFLFAPIGIYRNEMVLSVVSALVRLDVDPWGEAERLASLPREAATRQLAGLIARLPGGLPPGAVAPQAIAARLIGLLPAVRGADPSTSPAAGATGLSTLLTRLPHPRVLLVTAFLVLMLGIQLFMASRPAPLPPTAPAGVTAPAETAPKQTP